MNKRSAVFDFTVTMSIICGIWIVGGLLLGLLYNDSRVPTVVLTPEQKSTVKGLVYAPSIIGIICSGTLLVLFCVFKQFKIMHMRLVMMMCLSDWLLDASFFIYQWWPEFCAVQAAFSNAMPLASCLWTFFIAFTLFETLVRGRTSDELKPLEIFMQIFVWSISIISGILVLAIEMSSEQLAWCWIDGKFAAWRFLFFYLALFVVFTYNFVVYVIVVVRVHRTLSQISKATSEGNAHLESRRKTAKVASRVAYYLLAFFLTWIWGITHRIINLFDPNPVYPLIVLHTFFTPSCGMLNCLAYGFGHLGRIYKFIKMRFCGGRSCVPKRRRQQATVAASANNNNATTTTTTNSDAKLSGGAKDIELNTV